MTTTTEQAIQSVRTPKSQMHVLDNERGSLEKTDYSGLGDPTRTGFQPAEGRDSGEHVPSPTRVLQRDVCGNRKEPWQGPCLFHDYTVT